MFTTAATNNSLESATVLHTAVYSLPEAVHVTCDGTLPRIPRLDLSVLQQSYTDAPCCHPNRR